MSSQYKIIPLYQNYIQSKFEGLSEPMPKPPFRLCVVDFATGGGRTNAIMNLVMRFWLYKDETSIFDGIFIFSPTIHQDPAFSVIINDPVFEQIVAMDSQLRVDIIDKLLTRYQMVKIFLYILMI